MRTKVTVACAMAAFVVIAGGTAEATGLIHTVNIAKGAVTLNRLSPGVQKMVTAMPKNGTNGAKGLDGLPGAPGARGAAGAAGATGPMGATGLPGAAADKGDKGDKGDTGLKGLKGDTGADGAIGPQGPKGDTGLKGDKGDAGTNGTNGTNGVDGLNPAVAVTAANMQGFVLDGATLAGGELRLAGGFDGSTIAGADGATKTYPFGTLAGLDALSVSQHRDLRTTDGNGNPSADSVTIHVSLLNANRVAGCGFTNLVFNGYYNGDHQQDLVLDAVHGGKIWSTRPLVGVSASQAAPSTLAEIQANDTCAGGAQVVAISVDNGDTSGTGTTPAANFSAGADSLVIGFSGSFTRYDFGG